MTAGAPAPGAGLGDSGGGGRGLGQPGGAAAAPTPEAGRTGAGLTVGAEPEAREGAAGGALGPGTDLGQVAGMQGAGGGRIDLHS